MACQLKLCFFAFGYWPCILFISSLKLTVRYFTKKYGCALKALVGYLGFLLHTQLFINMVCLLNALIG